MSKIEKFLDIIVESETNIPIFVFAGIIIVSAIVAIIYPIL
jgi:hypothetical protein